MSSRSAELTQAQPKYGLEVAAVVVTRPLAVLPADNSARVTAEKVSQFGHAARRGA